MSAKWTHKVVKTMHGMQGERFDFPTAGTFDSEAEARDYAVSFAKAQAEVGGVQIDVRTRGSRLVAQYVYRDGAVVDRCARVGS